MSVQIFCFFLYSLVLGGFNTAPRSATDEEKNYQDMICLERRGGRFSQGEKGPEPLSPGAFIRFILYSNADKAHQSLSGSKGQTIHNLWRTLRACSELGSVS